LGVDRYVFLLVFIHCHELQLLIADCRIAFEHHATLVENSAEDAELLNCHYVEFVFIAGHKRIMLGRRTC